MTITATMNPFSNKEFNSSESETVLVATMIGM